ncbi:MAG: TolC family protein, partial [Bacteroidetes bacterium]|nr:TolC family protein [Bacteroidota bacterium]
MNQLVKIALTLTIFVAVTTLYAQKQWTLQECIQYALENNLNIKQQSLSIERDKNQLEQSRWALAPNLNIGSDYSLSWGRTANTFDFEIYNKLTQTGNLGISTSVDIFNGLQKVNTIKSNQAQLEISGQEVEKLKNDISINIARTFLQVILAQEILETAKLSRESVSEQVARTQILVNAGNLAQSSLLEMQAQLATEQVQVVNAQNQLRTNYLTLVQLLDLPVEEKFNISIPPIEIDTAGITGVFIDQLFQ